MIALDTNFLVYLLVSSHPDHSRAKSWFETNKEELATTNINISEALRLLTHPKVFPKPMTLNAAIDLLSTFKNDFSIFILNEKQEWLDDLRELSNTLPSIRGNEVFDAKIAQILLYNGVKKICTLDADFKKYDFLEVIGF